MDYKFAKSKEDPASVAVYAKFLSRVYPATNKLSKGYLTWLYKDNPAGKVVGCDAFYNGMLVAHYVTIPVLYNIRGEETKGLLALNTATDDAHRGKGLFTLLAKKTYEGALLLGYKFVIGVANKNSAPGYLKKLGFSLISPLDVRIGLGSVELNSPGNYSLRSIWSSEALSWRLANPSAHYFIKGRHIIASTGKPGIVAQLFQNDNTSSSLPLAEKKYPAFTLWIGIDDLKKEKKIFFSLPEKLKPSPLLLIFKDLTGTIAPFKKKDVFFELIDFDAY